MFFFPPSAATLAVLDRVIVTGVLAQSPPMVPCVGLAGCPGRVGNEVKNVLFTSTIPVIIGQLLNVATAAAVLFIVVAGGQMLIAQGDEAQTTNAKKGIAAAMGGLAAALAAKTVVAAVAHPFQFTAGSGDLIYGRFIPSLVGLILVILNVGFLIVIMIAGFRMVIAGGSEEEFKKSKEIVKWAIIGAIVINGARALIQAVLNLNL